MSTFDSLLDVVVVRKKPQKEGFEDTSKASPLSDIIGFTTIGIIIFVLFLIFCILYSVGAGRLSYCYSRSAGWSVGGSFLWSVLSFLFSNFYYPYYAFFNAPPCVKPAAPYSTTMASFTGGRRRGK